MLKRKRENPLGINPAWMKKALRPLDPELDLHDRYVLESTVYIS